MIKKYILIFLVLNVVVVACAENITIEKKFTGNWYRSLVAQNTVTKQYNWGRGKTIPNFTIEIDLVSEKKTIFLPLIGGPFTISEFRKINKNTFVLIFFFDRGGFDVIYHIHSTKEGGIWFEPKTTHNSRLIPIYHLSGEKFLWYRIDGP